MGTQIFHSKLSAQAGTDAGDVVVKSQLDAGVATAENRANHTGTQPSSTISDFQTAVDARVQLIVGAAPAALDTLAELADALGDDPNYAATITGELNTIDGRLDALESATTAGSFMQNIGDGTASTFTVTHNLATLDVRIEVVQIADGQTVYPVVTRPTTNTVGVDFGAFVPAAASHRVLITKVG